MDEINYNLLSPYEIGETGTVHAIPFLNTYLQNGSINEKKLAASAINKLSILHKKEVLTSIPHLLKNLSLDATQLRQYTLKALCSMENLKGIPSSIFEKIAKNDDKKYNRLLAQNILNKYFSIHLKNSITKRLNKDIENITFSHNESSTDDLDKLESKVVTLEIENGHLDSSNIVNDSSSLRADHEKKLNKIFNIKKFYDQQWSAIDQVFKKKKVLLIEKTGFGKSLCFQYPATHFKGVTIVFSPLIALMRDQIKYLQSIGVQAECINSEQENNGEIISDAIKGNYKILYIAPERLDNRLWNESVKKMDISMIVIDEAHCISVWGHDFRPTYRRIINLVQLMPETMPILATTATATRLVQEDIENQMGSKSLSIRGNLLRKNFRLKVVNVDQLESKMMYIKTYLDNIDGNGVIYVGTRSRADIMAQWLNASGIPSNSYHAGMDRDKRKEIENGLMDNQWKCVVSTNALGMGMDKPDLRFIIHDQIPQSPIHYYQEIGRGGRDGKKTDLILLYQNSDEKNCEALINKSKPSTDDYEKVLSLIKKSPQSQMDVIKQTNLTQTQVRTIFADLVEQGVCKKDPSTRKLSYVFGKKYEATDNQMLREQKLNELKLMVDYTTISSCRMEYLCNYLGDKTNKGCGKCDVCNDSVKNYKIKKKDLEEVNRFLESNFPILPVSDNSEVIIDGYAYSYYGTTRIGSMINKSKYQDGGDFPETLVNGVVSTYNKRLKQIHFDHIFYVPPTESGDLVKNFAHQLSEKINVPVNDGLVKIKKTDPQKIFASGHRKIANVKGKFSVKNKVQIKGKNVLIIDDVYDSGNTLKEICKVMKENDAALVVPLTIAKTLGG